MKNILFAVALVAMTFSVQAEVHTVTVTDVMSKDGKRVVKHDSFEAALIAKARELGFTDPIKAVNKAVATEPDIRLTSWNGDVLKADLDPNGNAITNVNLVTRRGKEVVWPKATAVARVTEVSPERTTPDVADRSTKSPKPVKPVNADNLTWEEIEALAALPLKDESPQSVIDTKVGATTPPSTKAPIPSKSKVSGKATVAKVATLQETKFLFPDEVAVFEAEQAPSLSSIVWEETFFSLASIPASAFSPQTFGPGLSSHKWEVKTPPPVIPASPNVAPQTTPTPSLSSVSGNVKPSPTPIPAPVVTGLWRGPDAWKNGLTDDQIRGIESRMAREEEQRLAVLVTNWAVSIVGLIAIWAFFVKYLRLSPSRYVEKKFPLLAELWFESALLPFRRTVVFPIKLKIQKWLGSHVIDAFARYGVFRPTWLY